MVDLRYDINCVTVNASVGPAMSATRHPNQANYVLPHLPHLIGGRKILILHCPTSDTLLHCEQATMTQEQVEKGAKTSSLHCLVCTSQLRPVARASLKVERNLELGCCGPDFR